MSIAEQLGSLSREMGMEMRRGMDRHGLTLAKVTNVTDPDKFNRVKCLPVGSEGEKDMPEETDWCYVMTPAGGMERGIFWFPQVDDLVVLAYLDNDPHRPIVIGCLWTTEVKPPYTITDGKVQDYAMRTTSKIELLMHDEKDKNKVTLTMPSGTTLVLDDENQKVSLQDRDGKNALQMDLKAGNVSVLAEKKIELAAGKNASITLEEAGNITIKAKSKVAIEGTNVEGKASAGLQMEGGTAKVSSNGTLDLTGNGPTTIKGLMVNIN